MLITIHIVYHIVHKKGDQHFEKKKSSDSFIMQIIIIFGR